VNLAESIGAALAGNVGVVFLAGARIYSQTAPELSSGSSLSPTVVYEIVDETDEGDTVSSLWLSHWRVASLADDYAIAYALSLNVRTCLHRHNGVLGGAGGVNCAIRQTSRSGQPFEEIGVFGLISEFEVIEQS